MSHRILNTIDDLRDFIRFLGNLKLPVTVEWVQGRDRTKEQNDLQWLWAAEVAAQFGDRESADVQAEWKLRHGVPILRADSPEFRAEYDSIIRPLPYATKLRAMKVLGFEVTSRMKVGQMIRYLDAVQRESLEMGFRLTEPRPDLAKYQSRYREAT